MWKTSGLLLTVCALTCAKKYNCGIYKQIFKKRCRSDTSTTWSYSTSSNQSTAADDQNIHFMLGSDGFMGYTAGNCSGGNFSSNLCSTSNSTALTKLLSISVFSFDNDTVCTGNGSNRSCKSDYGVNVSSFSPYILNISRSAIPSSICLFEGSCHQSNWTDWIQNCNWTRQKTIPLESGKCNVTCLDPSKTCDTAKYNPNCRDDNAGDESKINTFQIHNGTATCFKCGTPLQNPTPIPVPTEMAKQFNPNKTETDAVAAAGAMKNLSNLLSFMGNLTVASITMGNVKGVLKKIQSESEVKESVFIYSSGTGISVIEDTTVLNDYPNAFTVPKEAAQKAFNNSHGTAFLGVFRFPNMSMDENNSTVLNNEVYAIEMGTKISNLTNNISLSFSKKQTADTPVCVSWDGNGRNPNWTSDGCYTVVGDNITCKCEHLTFFAVLMMPPGVISKADRVALTYISYIGCGLSMFFLGIGLFMHFLIRKTKATNSVHVLINLFLALFLLNVAFLSNGYVADAKIDSTCKIMAGVMHYALLASFTWFAIEALHLCLQMAKNPVVIRHYIMKICVAGWVPPAIVVSVLFVLNKYGAQTIQTEGNNNTVTMCWILDSTVQYAVNIGYYCFVFIFTLTTFIVVLRWLSLLKLSRWSKTGKVQGSRTGGSDVSTILGLCCLLGLTWSISFFSYGVLKVPSYYIFTILNSLQGLFLFIYYLKSSAFIGNALQRQNEEETSEETKTENPYEDPADDKKAI